jgi:hypothetical protein
MVAWLADGMPSHLQYSVNFQVAVMTVIDSNLN